MSRQTAEELRLQLEAKMEREKKLAASDDDLPRMGVNEYYEGRVDMARHVIDQLKKIEASSE
jgi:hypothetical protein